MTSGLVAQLAQALDDAEQLIAGVHDSQLTAPTPCAEWEVRTLIGHLVSGNEAFAAIMAGQPRPAPAAGPDQRSAASLLSAYREAAGPLVVAFSQPGALERVVTVPFGTVPGQVALHLRLTEILVHGWDLASATGQVPRFAAGTIEQELAFSTRALADVPPGRRPFAPSTHVPVGAPPLDQLAALLGREVPFRPDAAAG
ncbi:MAG TPA: TIGR03086 family metal-binding protein [Streptosporangiaceae bacterium]|jgi:uncharacterized protein (TIGR03086 family)